MKTCIFLFLLIITFSSDISFAGSSLSLKKKLNEQCGTRFDGVNATYVPGLKRSLSMRKNNSPYPGKSKEIKELKCRIRMLKKYG